VAIYQESEELPYPQDGSVAGTAGFGKTRDKLADRREKIS
jgi:hypothetical protein